jgi:hypothetical protein
MNKTIDSFTTAELSQTQEEDINIRLHSISEQKCMAK